jgi:hypothetical protein
MNAVERLLAHAERVVIFFDEMLARQKRLDPRTAESVHRHLETYTTGGPFNPPAFELKMAPPRYTKALSADRLDLLSRWQSESALETAIARAVEEGARSKKRHGDGADLSPRALVIYCDLLAERELLLDPEHMQAMLADVVAESLSWGPHATTVASLSKSLADALGRLLNRPRGLARTSYGRPFMHTGGPMTHTSDWLSEKARHLKPAIAALQIYARPPAPAATSEEKTNGSRGRGGRPQNDEALARDLLEGWRAYEPEDGKRTKDRYLAQRADVRALKTEEARQRKIVSLRTTLESAQSLRRVKARQMRRARG